MDTTQQLLAAWREAEAALEAAQPHTPAARLARHRADVAKTAYLTHVNDVFDVEGHRHTDRRRRGEDPAHRRG